MKLKITKSAVDAIRETAKSTAQRIYAFDVDLTGFGCMATPTGATSFFVEFRYQGRKRRKSLGRYGPLSPHQARNIAQGLLGDVARGIDVASRPEEKLTMQAAFQRYLEHNSKPTGYWREMERCVIRDAASIFERDVKSISRAEIASLVDVASLRSMTAGGKLFASLRPFFRWASERGYIDMSPCIGLRPPPTPKARDRVLTNDEVREIWLKSDGLTFPFSQIVKLLILTAQRRSEVAGMATGEISGDVWTIPGERTKNGKLHEVDLHPLAMEVIEAAPHQERLLFTTTGRTPPSGFSKTKRNLDARLPDIPHWRFHDLRRTAASGMAALGVLPNVIERILNHQSGVNSGLVGVYQRHEYRAERREAIMMWGDYVAKILKA